MSTLWWFCFKNCVKSFSDASVLNFCFCIVRINGFQGGLNSVLAELKLVTAVLCHPFEGFLT